MARRKPMQARGGEYFTIFEAKTLGLCLTPTTFEGRPGLWVDTEADEGLGAQGYWSVLEFPEWQAPAVGEAGG